MNKTIYELEKDETELTVNLARLNFINKFGYNAGEIKCFLTFRRYDKPETFEEAFERLYANDSFMTKSQYSIMIDKAKLAWKEACRKLNELNYNEARTFIREKLAEYRNSL